MEDLEVEDMEAEVEDLEVFFLGEADACTRDFLGGLEGMAGTLDISNCTENSTKKTSPIQRGRKRSQLVASLGHLHRCTNYQVKPSSMCPLPTLVHAVEKTGWTCCEAKVRMENHR